MELENKVLSREIQTMLYESGKTLGTAESCTGGKIAEAIIAVPGASEYFKGAIVSYTNEVKERLLGVDHQLLEEKTAVCPEVAEAMVRGAIKTLNVDFAISATGIAGPGGGSKEIPVGTIYIGFGSADDVRTTRTLSTPPVRPSRPSCSSSRRRSRCPHTRDKGTKNL